VGRVVYCVAPTARAAARHFPSVSLTLSYAPPPWSSSGVRNPTAEGIRQWWWDQIPAGGDIGSHYHASRPTALPVETSPRRFRRRIMPLAEAAGYLTDEDVFRDVS
jgi:hypothetical protein